MSNLPEYTKEWAKEELRRHPWWQAVALDSGGCHWFESIPTYGKNLWIHANAHFIGNFTSKLNWKDTLVTRDDLVEYWEPKEEETFWRILATGEIQEIFVYRPLSETEKKSIKFRTLEAAEKAVAEMNRISLESRKIS